MEKHTYKVDLDWLEARKGIMSSPELDSSIEVVTPPEFDQGIAGIWSPEHLFTSAVLSCFMTTFLAIADYSKLSYVKFQCKAEGILEKVDGKYLMTEINLRSDLKISDPSQLEKAERILHKAEKACLISNSIKSQVNLDTNVSVVG